MIFSQKNILTTLVLLLCSNVAFGYNFTFSNVTEKTLVIAYKLEGLSQEYYQILMPDQSVSYYFPNLHCFGGSILWAEYKAKDALGRDLPFHGGIDLVDPKSGEILKGDAQNLFRTEVANKYAFIPMQIKVVDNETFQMTVNAAEELAQGIDSFSCETINTIKTFTNPLSPSSSMSGGMNKPATNDKKEGGISGAISNVINKIADKIGVSDKKEESIGNEYEMIDKSPNAIALLDNLNELLEKKDGKNALFFIKHYKNDLLNIISQDQFDFVYDHLNTSPEFIEADDYTDMLDKLKTKRPNQLNAPRDSLIPNREKKLKQDIDLSGTINTHMATTTSSTMSMNSMNTSASNKQCRFGLGQIAKGGGTLAGISLCRDLHFVIVDTGEIGSPAATKEGATVSRVKKPILIAEINQGG